MVTMRQGDCLELMQDIPDASIDIVVTSPPYDNLRTYNGTLVWNLDIFKSIADQLYRVLKDCGTIVWVVADATIDGGETGTSFRQALYFQEIGMKINDTMIWSKGSFSAVGALTRRYAQTFEYMFIFTKGKGKTFNAILDRKNKQKGAISGTIRQRNGEMKPMPSNGKAYREYGIRFNIWEMPPVISNTERTGHPAQFPEALARDHILSWSNAGDTVLDPFMGSGTTCVACVHTGRDFIGIEKDAGYFEIAKERIQKAQEDMAVHLFIPV